MSSSSRNIEYGNFEILWRGALRALLEEEEENNSEKLESSRRECSVEGRTQKISTQFSRNSQSVAVTTDPVSQDSPLKPVRKRKRVAIIESDSESDEEDVVAAVLDSDSDLEIVEEQWRSVDKDKGHRQHYTLLSQDEDVTESITSTNVDESSVLFKIPDTPDPDAPKAPKLSLDPKHFQCRRHGLRPRSMHSKDSSTTSHTGRERNRVSSNKNNTLNGISTRNSHSSTGRERRVPVSIEEELTGEDLWSSEDEEYEQRANGALIEREAQCSDEEGDDSELDGELEQSFINDQTLMSQQLSQDSMHGLYLQSIRQGW